jgi:hypothetical protein
MKNFMISLVAISIMALIGCGKSGKNDSPVGPDPIVPEPPPVVFTYSNNLPPIPAGWTLVNNTIGVGIFKGDGTTFGFTFPNGSGTRTFTGDSAALFTGKFALIGPSVWITKDSDPSVHKLLSFDPPDYTILSTVAYPDSNNGKFTTTIID